jgi:hypothetical protein
MEILKLVYLMCSPRPCSFTRFDQGLHQLVPFSMSAKKGQTAAKREHVGKRRNNDLPFGMLGDPVNIR